MADTTKIAPTFSIPSDLKSSERFRNRFNAVAQGLKENIVWEKDGQDHFIINTDEVKIDGNTVSSFDSSIQTRVGKIFKTMEDQRRRSVEASAKLHQRIPYRAPLELLSKAERRAVELFAQKVKPALDRIEARQQDPNAPKLKEWIDHHGGPSARKLFARFHRDSCAGVQYMQDGACSLFPFYPDQPPINGMIDPEISLDLFKSILSNGDGESIRPTTLVHLGDNGKIETTPLPLHPDFKADHQELAQALEEIANLKVDNNVLDPLLQDQLLKWAEFFRNGTAEAEAKAVQATIDAAGTMGRLRVHFGPSESYWSDNTKFAYLLQVGILDAQLAKELDRYSVTFRQLEDSLATLPNYKPRKVSTRGGFADPMYQAVTGGFMQTYSVREPAGNNFPNFAGYNAEGSNRFVLMETAHVSAEQLKTTLNRLVQDDLSRWDAKKNWVAFVAGHESGHLLGPQRDHITLKSETMGTIFGKYWADAEEPKADLTALAAIRAEYQSQKITKEETIDRLRIVLAATLGNRYKGKAAFQAGQLPAHYYGYVFEVGLWFKSGVLKMPNPDKKLEVDYLKMLDEGYSLWRNVMTHQANGDVEGFQKMAQELVTHIPDKADEKILEAGKGLPVFFIERHL